MLTPLSSPDAGRVAPISGSVLCLRFVIAFCGSVLCLRLVLETVQIITFYLTAIIRK